MTENQNNKNNSSTSTDGAPTKEVKNVSPESGEDPSQEVAVISEVQEIAHSDDSFSPKNEKVFEEDIEKVIATDKDESFIPVAKKNYAKATSFAELKLHEDLAKQLATVGWTEPTDIQGLCLPYTLRGKDVAGFAQTGTGKTGVFLITTAQKLLKLQKTSESKNGQAIILAPTRELAIQIEEECKSLFKNLPLTSLAVYGGIDYEKQAKSLQSKPNIIVATPGRLKDYTQQKKIMLNKADLFVCDEVDRMFDMGFIDDVEFFLDRVPEDCQKLFFSATTNDNVKELCFEYLNDPEYISVSPDEITPDRITQKAILCETTQKLKVFMGLLREHNPSRAIIFTNTKLTASWLDYKLRGNGFDVETITGDLAQRKRISLIRKIKKGEIKLLIATDVASRGLHIADVSHVYNFDLPGEAANYVHRIGRTARAGEVGVAYSLVCEEYAPNLLAINELLGESRPECTWFPTAYLDITDKSGDPFKDNFGKRDASERRPQGKKDSKPRKRGGGDRSHDDKREARKPNHKKSGNGPKKRKKDWKKSQPRGRDQAKSPRKPAVAAPQPTGFFALIKKFFRALFGSKS